MEHDRAHRKHWRSKQVEGTARNFACDECLREEQQITNAKFACAQCRRTGCSRHISLGMSSRNPTIQYNESQLRIGICHQGNHTGLGLGKCCHPNRILTRNTGGLPPPPFRWDGHNELSHENGPIWLPQIEIAASSALRHANTNQSCKICMENREHDILHNGMIICIMCHARLCHVHAHVIHTIACCNGWKFGICQHSTNPQGTGPFCACDFASLNIIAALATPSLRKWLKMA